MEIFANIWNQISSNKFKKIVKNVKSMCGNIESKGGYFE